MEEEIERLLGGEVSVEVRAGGAGVSEVGEEELIREIKERLSPEKVREFVNEYLRSQGLIQVKLVVFKLPTEYLNSTGEFERSDEGWIERRVLKIDPARMRTLRKKFYNILHEVAYRVEDMWVLRGNADPRKLDDVLREFHEELRRYGIDIYRHVRIVEAYMPRDYIVEKLSEYIEERKLALNEVVEKLRSENLKEVERRRLQKTLTELENEVSMLMNELKNLRGT